jgi:hypothetical protein
MDAYIDVADFEEDKRIDMIGSTAVRLGAGKVVAFVTDSDPGKADRYIAKLLKKFPTLHVIERFDGPVPNTVSVKIGVNS